MWKQTHSCGMLYFVLFVNLFYIYGSKPPSEKQGKNCVQLKRYERRYFCTENPRASRKHGKAGVNNIWRILNWEIKENSYSVLWYTNSNCFAHNKTLFATVALEKTQYILNSSEKMSWDSEMLRLCKLALENSLSIWFNDYSNYKNIFAAYIGTRVSREKTPIFKISL